MCSVAQSWTRPMWVILPRRAFTGTKLCFTNRYIVEPIEELNTIWNLWCDMELKHIVYMFLSIFIQIALPAVLHPMFSLSDSLPNCSVSLFDIEKCISSTQLKLQQYQEKRKDFKLQVSQILGLIAEWEMVNIVSVIIFHRTHLGYYAEGCTDIFRGKRLSIMFSYAINLSECLILFSSSALICLNNEVFEWHFCQTTDNFLKQD